MVLSKYTSLNLKITISLSYFVYLLQVLFVLVLMKILYVSFLNFGV